MVLQILGELRRIAANTNEIIRCGEEYIPTNLFLGLGGFVIDFDNKSQIIEKDNGLIYRMIYTPKSGPLRSIITDYRILRIIKKIIKDLEDNVVISHAFYPHTFKFLKEKGFKIILVSHGGYPAYLNQEFYKKMFGNFRKKWENKAIFYADHLIALSKYMVREYLSYPSAIPEKIVVIRSGAYKSLYNLRKSDELIVGFLGRINPQKGIFEFLELSKLYPDIKFIMIGYTNDKYKNKLLTLSKQYKIDNLEFYFNISEEEKRKLLSKISILISPYKGYDPAPNALYESIMSGNLIFTSLRKYRYEIFTNNVFYFDDIRDLDLNRHLQALGDNLHKIRKKIRKYAVKEHNFENMIKNFRQLMKD